MPKRARLTKSERLLRALEDEIRILRQVQARLLGIIEAVTGEAAPTEGTAKPDVASAVEKPELKQRLFGVRPLSLDEIARRNRLSKQESGWIRRHIERLI